MAGGPVKRLPPAAPDSLEDRATRQGAKEIYLGRRSLGRLGVVESRLFGESTASDWSELFDGVVVIREEQPATGETSN